MLVGRSLSVIGGWSFDVVAILKRHYCSDIKSILSKMAAHKRGLYTPEIPRHVRLKRSRLECGVENRVSSQIALMCVSNGFGCSPKSVLVRLEHRSYLIGCGEGTQRILTELPLKFLKISHVFITRKSWQQIGGILGLAITLKTSGLDELKLNAPFRLKPYIEQCRTIEGFGQMRLVEHEHNEYEDDTFRVTRYAYPSDGSTCFLVFDSRPMPGRLSVEKCAVLGVPMNKCRAKLKNGESITLESGKVIEPSDVLEDPLPNIRFVIIDFPSLSSETTQFFLDKLDDLMESDESTILYFIHMAPSELQSLSEYSAIMESRDYFKRAVHVALDESMPCIDSNGIFELQSRLSCVSPLFFPPFPHGDLWIGGGGDQKLADNVPLPTPTDFGQKIDLATGIDIDLRKQHYFINSSFQTSVHKQIAIEREPRDPVEYPRLIFLGTGASCPSKTRNMSSILLEANENCSILMDCGEGSLMQLNRLMIGRDFDESLARLKVIFISHMHPDHHQALYGILEQRNRSLKTLESTTDSGVLLFCPLKLQNMFRETASVFDSGSNHVLESVEILLNKYVLADGLSVELKNRLTAMGILDLSPVPVDHIYDSHGLVIDLVNKGNRRRLVYSGDCRPTNALADSGRNADILIHEATLEDGMEDEAEVIKHSTVSEALRIAKRMNAHHTILTHFSQRYNKVIDVNPQFEMDLERVHLAFDHLVVPFDKLDELQSIKEPLKDCFASEFRMAEQRRSKLAIANTARKNENK